MIYFENDKKTLIRGYSIKSTNLEEIKEFSYDLDSV